MHKRTALDGGEYAVDTVGHGQHTARRQKAFLATCVHERRRIRNELASHHPSVDSPCEIPNSFDALSKTLACSRNDARNPFEHHFRGFKHLAVRVLPQVAGIQDPAGFGRQNHKVTRAFHTASPF